MLQTTGAAPSQGGLRLLSARLLAEQVPQERALQRTPAVHDQYPALARLADGFPDPGVVLEAQDGGDAAAKAETAAEVAQDRFGDLHARVGV